MSSMLEQAIVDAKALKEAALKNAEQAVIDKYSSEIKAAVEELLEGNDNTQQEVIKEDLNVPYASDPDLAQDKPVEMEMEFEFNPEDFRIDLDSIKTQAEADPESAGEEPQDTESLAADIGLGEEDLETPELDLGGAETGDLAAEPGAMLQESQDDEDELLNELLSLLEEDEEEVLDESLTVDMGDEKHGWFTTDKGTRTRDAEMEAARLKASESDKENEQLKDEIENLKLEIDNFEHRQAQLGSVLNDMKGKLEEMVLQNARLLYSNKVLRDSSLNERQKDKIVEAIAKAETLKEAKALYTTLKETTVGAKQKAPKSLSESVQRKQVLSAHLPRRKQENLHEELDFSSRMKKLAGLD